MSQHAKLLLKNDPETSYIIEEKEYVIGRSDECDIQLADGFVSRRQARLYFESGHFVLENTGSNPVFVNGNRVDRHFLNDHDEIALGKSELVFRMQTATPELQELPAVQSPAEDKTVMISSPLPKEDGPRLVITSPGGEAKVYPLKNRRLLIGRSVDADLRLDDPTVSRKHCVIEKEKGSYVIRSLTYTNPVIIDDQVANERPLVTGDQFRIGPYHITFLSERAETFHIKEEGVVLRTKERRPLIRGALALLILCAAGYGITYWLTTPRESTDRLREASRQLEAGELEEARVTLSRLLDEKLSPAEMQKANELLSQVALSQVQRIAEGGNVREAKNLLGAFLTKHGGGDQAKALRDRLDLFRLQSAQDFETSGDYVAALREFSAVAEESPSYDQAQQGISRIWLSYQQKQMTPLPIPQLLDQADEHFQAKRYTTPPNKNAYVIYQMILTIDPHNVVAMERINQMKSFYREQGEKYFQQKNCPAALSYFERLMLIDPDDPAIKERVTLCRRGMRRAGFSPQPKSSAVQSIQQDPVRDLLQAPADPSRQ